MKNICCSACLLGINCRYDGKMKKCESIEKLKKEYNLIPICPEVLGGLPTPRVASERVGDLVINKEGQDNTLAFLNGAKEALRIYKENNCEFVILKESSPSCGSHLVYDGTFSGKKIKGEGVCAQLFKKYGIIIYSEEEIEEIKA